MASRSGELSIACVRVYSVAQPRPTVCHPINCNSAASYVYGRFPGKNTGEGCHFLLQEIFPTPGIKPASIVSPASAGGFFSTCTVWEVLL